MPGETPQELITLISGELAEQIGMTKQEIENLIENLLTGKYLYETK